MINQTTFATAEYLRNTRQSYLLSSAADCGSLLRGVWRLGTHGHESTVFNWNKAVFGPFDGTGIGLMADDAALVGGVDEPISQISRCWSHRWHSRGRRRT